MKNANSTSYQKVVERVKCIKGFYTHLMIYILVITFLAILNLGTSSYIWVLFPAIGWGIGLTGHALNAFGYNPFLGKDWEERKIKQLMENTDFD